MSYSENPAVRSQFTSSSTCERSPEVAVQAELHDDIPDEEAEDGAEEIEEG